MISERSRLVLVGGLVRLIADEKDLIVSITSVMAVVTVRDFDGGISWYERFFGRPPDARPMDGLAQWHPIGNAAVQLVHDSDRGGKALVTFGVDRLDGQIAELAGRDINVGDVIEGVIARITSVKDPEGNVITLAELRA